MECDLAKQVIRQEPPLSRFPSHLKALFTCLSVFLFYPFSLLLLYPLDDSIQWDFPLRINISLFTLFQLTMDVATAIRNLWRLTDRKSRADPSSPHNQVEERNHYYRSSLI